MDNVSKSKEIIEKIKKTNEERYGFCIEDKNLNENILKNKNSILNKRKQTCLERYGVESISQINYVKDKRKNTCLKKYGVSTILLLDYIREKSLKSMKDNKDSILKKRMLSWTKDRSERAKLRRKQTCLERYGVGHIAHLQSTQKNRENTCLEKYGCKSVIENENIKNKIRKTCLDKYGFDNVLKNKEIRLKITNTIIKKYGVKNVFQNINIKEKIKNTCLKKYGSEHYLSSNDRFEHWIGRYGWIPKDKLSAFEKYRRQVDKITRKNLKELFSNWNGFCYYESDNKLLTDSLFKYHSDYATVDHKTSVHYGFHNNMTADEIGGISNLCICSRKINTSKNYLTEEEYYEKTKKNN